MSLNFGIAEARCRLLEKANHVVNNDFLIRILYSLYTYENGSSISFCLQILVHCYENLYSRRQQMRNWNDLGLELAVQHTILSSSRNGANFYLSKQQIAAFLKLVPT